MQDRYWPGKRQGTKAWVKASETHKSCVMLRACLTSNGEEKYGHGLWLCWTQFAKGGREKKNVNSAPFSLAFGRWFFQNSCSNSCWVTVRSCLAWTQKAEEQHTWVYWEVIQISRDILVAASLQPLYWHCKCCCIPEVEWGGDSLVWDAFPFGISGAFFPGSSALVHFSVLHLRVENIYIISHMCCVCVCACEDIKQDDFSYSDMSPEVQNLLVGNNRRVVFNSYWLCMSWAPYTCASQPFLKHFNFNPFVQNMLKRSTFKP